MSVLQVQESILNSLQNLKSLDALKKLFWSQLNYELNNAFIIDGAKRVELIAQDPRSAEIIKPLTTGKNIEK